MENKKIYISVGVTIIIFLITNVVSMGVWFNSRISTMEKEIIRMCVIIENMEKVFGEVANDMKEQRKNTIEIHKEIGKINGKLQNK